VEVKEEKVEVKEEKVEVKAYKPPSFAELVDETLDGKLIFKDQYEINWKHIFYPVVEVYDNVPELKTLSSTHLIKLYEETTIPDTVWSMWQYSGKAHAKSALETVVEYCENNSEAGDEYKKKITICNSLTSRRC